MSTDAVAARSRRSFQQEIAPSDRNRESERQRSREAAQERREAISRRRSRRRGNQPSEQTPEPPSVPASTQPVTTPAPVSQPSEERTLAERYVAQYESQAGVSLTSEQRSAKVAEVEKFYQGRQGRLDRIVFA